MTREVASVIGDHHRVNVSRIDFCYHQLAFNSKCDDFQCDESFGDSCSRITPLLTPGVGSPARASANGSVCRRGSRCVAAYNRRLDKHMATFSSLHESCSPVVSTGSERLPSGCACTQRCFKKMKKL